MFYCYYTFEAIFILKKRLQQFWVYHTEKRIAIQVISESVFFSVNNLLIFILH